MVEQACPATLVVIPTYNERDNIRQMLPALLGLGLDLGVLVVDDNSPDRTDEVVAAMAATEPRIHLLRRPQKQGIGPAYISGFTEALRLGAKYIVQMDADFSHPVEKVVDFVRQIESCDVVLGSRYLNGITVVNWPIERLLLSYFGNWYARKVTRLPVSDMTGGFKCWRREILERIQLERVRSNGYAFQIEMSYRAWRHGAKFSETPIIFMDRTVGDSKMNKRIAGEALWIVWWLRLMDLTGRL